MGTSKPKIQCYIDQSLFDLFEAERHEWGLNQSQAWERILSERYSQDAKLAQDPSDERLGDRIKTLEENFANLASNFIELKLLFLKALPDTCLLDKLLQITSDTPSDTLQITSDTPSDTLQITSDTPEIISKSPTRHSSELFVICEFFEDRPEDLKYWCRYGRNKNFSQFLKDAIKYKFLAVADREANKIKKKYPTDSGWQIRCQTLEFLERKQKESSH